MFDTGADYFAVEPAGRGRARGRDAGHSRRREGRLSGGLGARPEQTWLAPFDSFNIGDEEIQQTKLRFGDLSFAETDMLIGADFFLSHRVFVASSQRKLYFTYNGGPGVQLDVGPR